MNLNYTVTDLDGEKLFVVMGVDSIPTKGDHLVSMNKIYVVYTVVNFVRPSFVSGADDVREPSGSAHVFVEELRGNANPKLFEIAARLEAEVAKRRG